MKRFILKQSTYIHLTFINTSNDECYGLLFGKRATANLQVI